MLDTAFDEPLRRLLRQTLHSYGQPRSLWTLELVAQVCHDRDWTPRVLSSETIRQAICRLGVSWRRAQHWITSPDPAYTRKKKARDRLLRLVASHPDWVLGFPDECWWSRLAQPNVPTWAAEEPARLQEHNRRVKREGRVRLATCRLPSKSPWLNTIEPHWVHGKRAIVQLERVLSATEVDARACEYYGCARQEHLQRTHSLKKRKKVA